MNKNIQIILGVKINKILTLISVNFDNAFAFLYLSTKYIFKFVSCYLTADLFRCHQDAGRCLCNTQSIVKINLVYKRHVASLICYHLITTS